MSTHDFINLRKTFVYSYFWHCPCTQLQRVSCIWPQILKILHTHPANSLTPSSILSDTFKSRHCKVHTLLHPGFLYNPFILNKSRLMSVCYYTHCIPSPFTCLPTLMHVICLINCAVPLGLIAPSQKVF